MRYRDMDGTPVGMKLTAMRIEMVRRYAKGMVVDIGIGGGRFVAALPGQSKGFDINPAAVDWLKGAGRWHDPYSEPCESATFWDSLEHIHDPTEHCWYFTVAGIQKFMAHFGFEQLERNGMEQRAGRQQIESFVFKRT
jgi:hypothetical protein